MTLYKTENGKIAETSALVDSGATICCINLHFVRRMKWSLLKLKRPIEARNADGTSNKGGRIRYQVNLNLRIEDRNSLQHFFVMDLGNKNTVILGHPWLTKTNPLINWTARTVSMRGTPVPRHDDPRILEQRYLLWYLHATEKDNSELADRIYTQQRNTATLLQVLGKDHPHIRKLSLSTALAQAAKRVEQKLPPQYAKYAKVFDEPKGGELPPRRPFDYGIDLKETFIPKVAKSYPMNPKETEACKAFIDEHLKSGKIRKSQSPKPPHFSLFRKRMADYNLARTTAISTSTRSKNAYPLPLITTLIDKLKGAKYFSKMDMRWGYNNIRIKEGDEWKATFTTPFSLYEPLVMFFGQCNSLPTFQAFMDSTFGDMIAEGWLIIYMDNVLVFAETLEECQVRTKWVLERMREEDLHLKLAKCAFDQTEVEYLGLVVRNGEVLMDPTKLKAVEQWEPPKSVKVVRSFIGFCNFY